MDNINSIFKQKTNNRKGKLLFDDELKYRMMIELTNEGVWILDNNSNTVYVNDRMSDMLGYTREEMEGKSLFYFIEPGLVEQANKNIERRRNGITEELEFRFKKKNNMYLWALINVTPCFDEENKYIGSFAMLTDVTDRVKYEEEICKLNRIYSVLSDINQTIVREKDKQKLMDEVCRTAVEKGGFKMSWVGFVDPVSKNVIPFSKFGYDAGYLENIQISVLDIPTGKGPTGTSIRENRHIFCNDIKNDPLMSPWKEEQLKRGYLSSCSLPLKIKNNITGAFTIYSGELNFFNEREIKLLKEMTDDLSFALENIELEKINRENEKKILDSKQRIEEILGSISDGFFTLDREWKYSYINSQGAKMVGKTPAEITGKCIWEVFPEVLNSKYYEVYNDVMNNRQIRHFDEYYKPLDNWYQGTVYPYTDGISIIFQNVTEKKIKEEEIVKSLKEKEVMLREIYHRVKNNLQVISSLLKLQGKYAKDEQTAEFFNISQLRVKSMALVHEKLYRSKDLSKIDFEDYIRKLTLHLLQSYGITKNEVRVNIEVKNVYLTVENAIPCGLIINEMVSNSIKHAFPDKRNGEISIRMFIDEENKYNLSVKDNGIGFPSGIDFRNSTSLGLELLVTLTEQLDGKIELKTENGTEFFIKFKPQNYSKRL